MGNFALEELDGLRVSLGELLLQTADEHVLEVVFVACACLSFDRSELVVDPSRRR